MNIALDPRLPNPQDPSFRAQLVQVLREYAKLLDALSKGRMVASVNAASAAPTAGLYGVGDFVKNTAVAELGSAGSKYTLQGWTCSVATTASTPATFLEVRALTGN